MTKAVTGLCMGCMGQLGGQRICPHCGYDADAMCDKNYIQPGTVLQSRYIVGRLAHKNGEGAQYIGYDDTTRTPVWIQEYFPRTIAQRGEETGNVLALHGFGAQYKALMSDFVDLCNEVKRLSVTEPVVPIENIVYANNTVYAIYRDLDVIPLETWLTQQGGGLPLDQASEMFIPLLNTLSNMHNHGVIHRGISPYTVYTDKLGQLYLWDFALSATRTADSELECELFSGYSAPEQYASNSWQGTWTDVYAMGALLYRILSGVVPPKSTLIGSRRPLVPLEDLVMGLPQNVSNAIASAMTSQSEERTQAMATLCSHLMQGGLAHTAVYDTNMMPRRSPQPPAGSAAKRPATPQPRRWFFRPDGRGGEDGREDGTGKYVMIATGLTVAVLLVVIAVILLNNIDWLIGSGGSSSSSQSSQSEEESQAPGSRDVPLFVGQKADTVTLDSQYEERFEFSIKSDYNEEYPEGTIYNQSPVEGTLMPEKGVVILHVSKGPALTEMPELVGLTLEEATDILNKMDLAEKFEVFERYDAASSPGTVLRTTPEAGTEIDTKKQRIYLFVVPEASVIESNRQTESSSHPSVGRDDESKPFHFWE